MRKPIRTAVLVGVLGLIGAVTGVAVTQTSAAATPATASGYTLPEGAPAAASGYHIAT